MLGYAVCATYIPDILFVIFLHNRNMRPVTFCKMPKHVMDIWNLRTEGQGRWMIIQCRLSRFRLKSDQLRGVTLKKGLRHRQRTRESRNWEEQHIFGA